MTEKTLTTENIKPALDALRGELAPWPVVAKKQDRLNTAQLNAANSGITSSLVAQIIANTAAIRALESAITGTGLRALVVTSLPAIGTQGILYIVPVTTYDPDTDADVVNYSNEYIWIPVEGGTASEGHYEQVGQTGIVINNGQLNITVNGTSVGTFTANQSGDTTAAITVPTNADYVDLTTDQTVAGVKTFSSTINGTAAKAIADEDGTSIKTGYVNVAGNQTVSGQKTWSGNQFFTSPIYPKNTSYEIGNTPASNVAIPIYFTDKNNVYTGYARSTVYTSGRTATEIRAKNAFKNGVLDPTGSDISSNLNVEVQPSGAKTIYWDGLIRNDVTPYTTNNNSLGSSTNQWSSVYAQNYYYNGTEFSSKFVTTDTNQEIGGTKAFTGSIRPYGLITHLNQSLEKGTIPSANRYGGIIYNDKTFANNVTHRFADQVALVDTTGTSAVSLSAYKWEANSLLKTVLELGYPLQGNTFLRLDTDEVIPGTTAVTDLGTSTNKWKTLNGINPGALSFPDGANYINVGGSILPNGGTATALDGSANYFTPTIDGWLSLAINSCSDLTVWASRMRYGQRTIAPSTGQNLQVMLPVFAGQTYEIRTIGSSINTALLFPCLGNV